MTINEKPLPLCTGHKKDVLEVYPTAFCQRGTWDGYNIWVRGDDPKSVGWGQTPRLAWRDAARRLKGKQKKGARHGKRTA